MKFGQKYKWFKISHVESFFWKYYFRHTGCLYTFQWTSSEFPLISNFLTEILKANKNHWKRSLILQYSFAQKLYSFYESHFTWHWKQYAPATQLKPFPYLQIFQKTYFCLVSEITFAQHHFFMPKNHILEVLKASSCSGLAKCFTIFHFNWKSWKSNYFCSISILLSIELKRRTFADFKGKLVATFLLRSHFLSI